MTFPHPRLQSPDEILRWVHGLEMTSDGIFKHVSSLSHAGVLTHRSEKFLTWTQCASREPINLVVGTLGWRRDGGDRRFDLSDARLASVDEQTLACAGFGMGSVPGNPLMALQIDPTTTLLVDSVTLVERVLLQNQHAFELAMSPFRDLFIECATHDGCIELRCGPMILRQQIEGFLRRSAPKGGLPRLITWLESTEWRRYFGALLHAVRRGAPPPLPEFAVSGWIRYDGMRVGQFILVEYLSSVVEQIGRPQSIVYKLWRQPLSLHLMGDFPKCSDGEIDFEEPYDYVQSQTFDAGVPGS